MAIRSWSRWQRPWLIGTLVAAVAVAAAPMVSGAGITLPLLVLIVVGGFLVVPRFGRLLLAGVLGGVVTGAIVLGGSLRVAMRIVAVMDPGREPELTPATFVIILVGVFFGLSAGIVIAVLQRLWRPRPLLIAWATGLVGIGLFLLAPDLRRELFEEGAGALVNIPLFTSTFFAFGWSAAAAVARLGAAAMTPRTEVPVGVPA
jgi:hypothetical protein